MDKRAFRVLAEKDAEYPPPFRFISGFERFDPFLSGLGPVTPGACGKSSFYQFSI
jgi:hypothetical protein